ncbi:MAG: hypothetical protein R3B91_15085 [Planctomycetaceae bacterium]
MVRLNQIPASNCFVAISGSAIDGTVKQHLSELKRLGVHVLDADKSPLLRSLQQVCRLAKDDSNLLIVGISSHGFDDGTVPTSCLATAFATFCPTRPFAFGRLKTRCGIRSQATACFWSMPVRRNFPSPRKVDYHQTNVSNRYNVFGSP